MHAWPQGRASHAYQLMCLFPSFAKKYQKIYETLIYGDGPLPYDWRLYVAIMVRVGPLDAVVFVSFAGRRSLRSSPPVAPSPRDTDNLRRAPRRAAPSR